MTDDSKHIQIQKLDGADDYADWSIQMKYYLSVSDGQWEALSIQDFSKATATEVKADKKARSKIMLHLSAPLARALENETKTAKEAWGYLETLFMSSTQARRSKLLCELATFELQKLQQKLEGKRVLYVQKGRSGKG